MFFRSAILSFDPHSSSPPESNILVGFLAVAHTAASSINITMNTPVHRKAIIASTPREISSGRRSSSNHLKHSLIVMLILVIYINSSYMRYMANSLYDISTMNKEDNVTNSLLMSTIASTSPQQHDQKEQQKVSSSTRPAILLFGDSLTQQGYAAISTGIKSTIDKKNNDKSQQEQHEPIIQIGWASLLSNTYTRRADVFNRGFSGYNTRHALQVLDNVIDSLYYHNILFCTIFLGANDAALQGNPQHVPLNEYKTNLIKIITQIR